MVQIGDLIAGYKVTKELDKGRNSQVFEVEKKSFLKLKEKRVLKVLFRNNLHGIIRKYGHLLLKREYDVLSKVNHQGLPKVYKYFEPNANNNDSITEYCLLMEKIDGKTLDYWLNHINQEPLKDEILAIYWLESLVNILDHIHKKAYVHRDIKPSNIMVKPNLNLVLIDFSNVERLNNYFEPNDVKIRQQLIHGTSGYSDSDMRYDDPKVEYDLFSLGRTFCFLLTQKNPINLEYNQENKSQLNWRNNLNFSSHFLDLIDRLMAEDIDNRPSSCQEVLEEINSIKQQFSAKKKLYLKSYIAFKKSVEPILFKYEGLPAFTLTNIIIFALIVGIRSLGLLQGMELFAYDLMMRIRPDEGKDERILVITIEEEDVYIQSQLGWDRIASDALSDKALSLLLSKLQNPENSASVIGLDIRRKLPVQDQQSNLIKQLQNDDFFAVCRKHEMESSTNDPDSHLPPPELKPEQLGFSDIVKEHISRRHLLSFNLPEDAPDPCPTDNSFSLQIALRYLDKDEPKITPELITIEQEQYLRLGNTIFKDLQYESGGYKKEDLNGYQILLNYRSRDIAETVNLRDAICDELPNSIDFNCQQFYFDNLKEKIVLIGVTYQDDDYHYTPYNNNKPIAGVFLQAQMISQIISAAKGERPLLKVWNKQWEYIWIFAWSLTGGLLAWRCYKIKIIIPIGVGITGILFVICLLLFEQGFWIPFIPPLLTLWITGGLVTIFIQRQQQYLG